MFCRLDYRQMGDEEKEELMRKKLQPEYTLWPWHLPGQARIQAGANVPSSNDLSRSFQGQLTCSYLLWKLKTAITFSLGENREV